MRPALVKCRTAREDSEKKFIRFVHLRNGNEFVSTSFFISPSGDFRAKKTSSPGKEKRKRGSVGEKTHRDIPSNEKSERITFY
jgi:hypothetical protein